MLKFCWKQKKKKTIEKLWRFLSDTFIITIIVKFSRVSCSYMRYSANSLSANRISQSSFLCFPSDWICNCCGTEIFRRFVSAITVFCADCLRTKLPGLTQSIATSTALATDLHECNRIASWTKIPQPLIKSSAQLTVEQNYFGCF